MKLTERLEKMFGEYRDDKEMEKWFMSLAPLTIAFLFFVIFMLPVKIENKDLILVAAGCAGFAGLQAYWVVRGWKRAEGMTILQGLLGIALALLVAWSYLHFLHLNPGPIVG
ncbi:MAG: YibE/F family protein [Gammaproteobacteria bacterium SHHR-1]|uniref:YibE/F family protein n=1 Tax=Magnetovirga frankeli TaxID=947516 RepID=UPI001292E066|nr:YibE/F family protein [gamma proteobacterium SS-5]